MMSGQGRLLAGVVLAHILSPALLELARRHAQDVLERFGRPDQAVQRRLTIGVDNEVNQRIGEQIASLNGGVRPFHVTKGRDLIKPGVQIALPGVEDQ